MLAETANPSHNEEGEYGPTVPCFLFCPKGSEYSNLNMTGTYDYRLVALSIVLATGASYAAFDLAGRVTPARRWARVFWLVLPDCLLTFFVKSASDLP